MSQQDEQRPQPRARLVFSREVNERLKDKFLDAFRNNPAAGEEGAMDVVRQWLLASLDSDEPAPRAFRQLLDHFIRSAIAQAWIDRSEGAFWVAVSEDIQDVLNRKIP
jgi:hypothetical protein